MIPYDYKCPQCGKYRPVDPACYEVGDIVMVGKLCLVPSSRGTSLRTVVYTGRIEMINNPYNAIVRRGVKGYGECHIEDIDDLTPYDAPGEIHAGEYGCQCDNNQNDNNEQDTHNH